MERRKNFMVRRIRKMMVLCQVMKVMMGTEIPLLKYELTIGFETPEKLRGIIEKVPPI
jgi:hypothetical protein